MAAGFSKYFSHKSHFTGGCVSRKCLLSSFCVSNLLAHLAQEKFLGFEYFLFNVYSTVLNTFFFAVVVSLFTGFSILIAVPIILGSNNGGAPSGGAGSILASFVVSPTGCSCARMGAIGTLYSSSTVSSQGTFMFSSWSITSLVSFSEAGFVTVVLPVGIGVVVEPKVLAMLEFLPRTGRGLLRGFVLYFSAAILLADGHLLGSTFCFFLGGEEGSSLMSYCE